MRNGITFHRFLSRPYFLTNGVLFLLLGFIFLYSALFSPTSDRYLFPSVYNRYMVQPSPTSGLSHSFSAMIRCDFQDARNWNPYGPRLFLFFLAEFLLRIVILIIMLRYPSSERYLIIADITLSTSGFLVAYGPLLLFWKYV